MEFIFKKTSELSDNEKIQICNLFLEVFEKKKTIEEFDKQFLNTPLGYSYHAMICDFDNIVGINTIIPYDYNYFGKDTKFALSVDTMTKKEFRNISTFKKLAKMVYDEAKKDGVSFVLGFPNDVSYKIFKKMLKWKDIGRLNFYFLPINIGNIKKNLKILSPINMLFVKIISFITKSINFDNKKISRNISKVNSNQFKKQRYSSEHIIKSLESFEFVYKIDEYENSKVVYLIDVDTLSKDNIQKATNYLIKKYGNRVDGILYLGNLDIIVLNLIKIPLKYEPKNLYVSGLILDETIIDDRVWNIKNWNLNLSNMDVL